MKDESQRSRRQFLAWGIGTASLAVCAGGAIITQPASARAEEIVIPLPYADSSGPVLDPEVIRRYAFNHYFTGGCMHGAATGLMQAYKEAFQGQGTGWDLIPCGMYQYGSGGVAGWGTLCGILNGCLAVLNLIGLHGKLGDQLMGWYSTTMFPTANCEGFISASGQMALPDAEVLAHTVADSPLCHISISKWCKAAGVSVADQTPSGLKYKDDRCGKICADAAAKTAELINEYALNPGVSPAPFTVPDHYASCLDCHSELKDQVGKMDCLGCHGSGDVVLVSRRHPVKGR